jgi:16S rRNA (guanine527-N7)-methyltransferase
MPTLTDPEIAAILAPFATVPAPVVAQLAVYLDLLLKWNARTNLTAIRDPREIVARHFGESVFTATQLPAFETLLDFGSGAGFPGLPIQLMCPQARVTLAESQNKKASFLREVVRTLGLKTEIWAARVEEMPASRLFDVVTLRAVDNPDAALVAAKARLAPGGTLASLTARPEAGVPGIPLPGSLERVLSLTRG